MKNKKSKNLQIVIIAGCVVFVGVIIGLFVYDSKKVRDEVDYAYGEGSEKANQYHQGILNDIENSISNYEKND